MPITNYLPHSPTPAMLHQFTLIRQLRKKLEEPQKLFTGLYPTYEEGGQFKIVSDTPQAIYRTSNLIQTALLDCESANPFEELGIDFDIIFSKNTPADESRIKMEILKMMKDFSDRLEVTSISVTSHPETGEVKLNMEIYYKPLKKKVELSGLLLGGVGNG